MPNSSLSDHFYDIFLKAEIQEVIILCKLYVVFLYVCIIPIKVKSVQSALSHLQSPPEQMQSQSNYVWLFLVKITSSGHDLINNGCPKSPK